MPSTRESFFRLSHYFQQRLEDLHDIGFSEHVQLTQVGPFRTLMSGEADGTDMDGNPVEFKNTKKKQNTNFFFQMVGSGCTTVYLGRTDNGMLKRVDTFSLEDIADAVSRTKDMSMWETTLLRNLEHLKEYDRKGCFDNGQVNRMEFSPEMKLRPVRRRLLPNAKVVRQVLGL